MIRLRLADFSNIISLEMPGANTDGLIVPPKHELPGAGHFIQEDAPQIVVPLIEEFCLRT